MNNTPDNINDLSMKEVLSLIEPDKAYENITISDVKTRVKLLRVLYDIFGYDLTNDALLALASEPSAELILATAGAGKTTAVQSKIVLEKVIRQVKSKKLQGSRVLCIVYNKHNVKQMTKAQEKLVGKLRARGIRVDSDIAAHTMHSYCYKWFNHFNHLTQFIGGTMLEQVNIAKQFESLCNILLKDSDTEVNDTLIDTLISLYNLIRETMTDYEDCDTVELFETIDLSKDVVVKIFNAYDKGKQRRNQYDYTDMLQELYNLLKDNKTVRTYIQEHYDYIVADEVQDMTKIMMEILKLSKREDVPLLCIGDEDQNIYSFRGATIKTILDFENMFEDAKVFSLSTNRRCGKNIVELAEKIISKNTLRYEKSMRALRDGGDIEFIPYCKHEDQIQDLCNRLKKMPKQELDSTCICYRNRRSSLLLSSKLEECGIPLHIMSGYPPYSAEVFQHILSIFRILLYPYDRDEVINIYKILPLISKNMVYETLGYSPKTKNFNKPYEKKHFAQYDFGQFMDNQKVISAIRFLKHISDNISKLKLSDYIKEMFMLFDDAFWKSKMYYNKNQEEDNMFTRYAFDFFNVDIPFTQFYENFSARMDKCKIDEHQKNGVCLSTFHSLKGLEFDNVFIIDLNDNIFPNFNKIDENNYSDTLKLELKESETRLFFVAVTRAKNKLVFYYDKEEPSTYIDWIMEDSISNEQITPMDVFNENELEDLFANTTEIDLFGDSQDITIPIVEEPPKPEEPLKEKDFSSSFLDTVMDRFFG